MNNETFSKGREFSGYDPRNFEREEIPELQRKNEVGGFQEEMREDNEVTKEEVLKNALETSAQTETEINGNSVAEMVFEGDEKEAIERVEVGAEEMKNNPYEFNEYIEKISRGLRDGQR